MSKPEHSSGFQGTKRSSSLEDVSPGNPPAPEAAAQQTILGLRRGSLHTDGLD